MNEEAPSNADGVAICECEGPEEVVGVLPGIDTGDADWWILTSLRASSIPLSLSLICSICLSLMPVSQRKCRTEVYVSINQECKASRYTCPWFTLVTSHAVLSHGGVNTGHGIDLLTY